jgi:hypothetical protein
MVEGTIDRSTVRFRSRYGNGSPGTEPGEEDRRPVIS